MMVHPGGRHLGDQTRVEPEPEQVAAAFLLGHVFVAGASVQHAVVVHELNIARIPGHLELLSVVVAEVALQLKGRLLTAG